MGDRKLGGGNFGETLDDVYLVFGSDLRLATFSIS
jgi:hypothetical protein